MFLPSWLRFPKVCRAFISSSPSRALLADEPSRMSEFGFIKSDLMKGKVGKFFERAFRNFTRGRDCRRQRSPVAIRYLYADGREHVRQQSSSCAAAENSCVYLVIDRAGRKSP